MARNRTEKETERQLQGERLLLGSLVLRITIVHPSERMV